MSPFLQRKLKGVSMSTPAIQELEAALTKVKAEAAGIAALPAVAKVEATVESEASTLVHKFITTGKAWIPIVGVAVIVILFKAGVAEKLCDFVENIVYGLILLHYFGQYVVDICNAAVAVAKERNKADPAAPPKV